MGSHPLRPIYPSKFFEWINRVGFTDEFHFWSSLSGISKGTMVDHMNHYLTSLGYVGTNWDKRKQFLIDQTSVNNGTLFDRANEFFDGSFSGVSVPSGEPIADEAGGTITDEAGGEITAE